MSSFWTENGLFSAKSMPGHDEMTCQPEVQADSALRNQERSMLDGLVPFIGNDIERIENSGKLHVWHGDCLHWLIPGIPDLYASELADFLLETVQ